MSRMGVSHLAPGKSRNLGVRLRLRAGQLQTKLQAPWSQGTALATGCLPGAGEAVGHDETSLVSTVAKTLSSKFRGPGLDP